jgi:hypothetical protein
VQEKNFVDFATLYYRKKAVTSSATQSFKPLILSHQPSTTTTTTITGMLLLRNPRICPVWLKSRRKTPPPIVAARELHDNFREVQGYFRLFHVILGTFRGMFFVFLYMYFVFCKIPEINIKTNDDASLTPNLSHHHVWV